MDFEKDPQQDGLRVRDMSAPGIQQIGTRNKRAVMIIRDAAADVG